MSDPLRKNLLRIASNLPVGDPTRREILAAVQGKRATGLGTATTVKMHQYRPGDHIATVMFHCQVNNALGDGTWAEDSGDLLSGLADEIPTYLSTVIKAMRDSMPRVPEKWGLQTPGGHTKFEVRVDLESAKPRYFPKANVVNDTRYVVVKMKNPEDFDPATFQAMLKTFAGLLGLRFSK